MTSPSKFPEPTRDPRHTEWTRKKMVMFLRDLAATQSVSAAARTVGMSRQTAYRLRNRLKDTPFDLGWEVALEMGFGQLAQAVMDRALNGVEEQRWYHGELVGTVRKFDNRLAQWVLSNPWKVGRNQAAREFSAEQFDDMLEFVEKGPLDWPEDAKKENLPNSFEEGSWYMAEAAWQERKPRRR